MSSNQAIPMPRHQSRPDDHSGYQAVTLSAGDSRDSNALRRMEGGARSAEKGRGDESDRKQAPIFELVHHLAGAFPCLLCYDVLCGVS